LIIVLIYKMKKILFVLLFFSLTVFSQNEQLAQNYFDKGDFEKALISYEELLKMQPSNSNYFQKTTDCQQQLKQYEASEKAIQERFDKYKQANLLVELGYNFQLKKDLPKAKKYYEEALGRIQKNANEVYAIAQTFEKKILIDYALQSYKIAIEKDPKFNFNFQMALLYGQQGNTDMMITTFLDEAAATPQNSIMIQNQLSRFMIEDADATFNETLRKNLLLRAQKDQNILWNQYLSWFFVQQKDYGKAFVQEKSIYKRNPESFNNIVNLGQLAIEENENDTAKDILTFVLENTQDIGLLVQSNFSLMQMRVNSAKEIDYSLIQTDLENLLKEFGVSPYTLSLQILQAHFVTFNLKNPEQGKTILKTALELQLDTYETADVKMELADILIFEEKFNQALIYYTQIEEDLKNDVIGHEASLKAAKTSYFKTDFEWASKQFKELKSASTQLIANDAMEYFLLISDNTFADSTQTALKKFARADFQLYQKKTNLALEGFLDVLKNLKEKEIEAITLYRIGKIYEKMGDYPLALNQYQKIIADHKDEIYTDEALYFSAEIYNKQLKDPEKAKAFYEKVIMEHEDSIYFVEARKKYRLLRGDTNL
jgi:tetratricopeptide (TPR) repeat protein